MSLRVLAAAAALMFTAGIAHANDVEQRVAPGPGGIQLAQACGWYAIGTCSRRPGPARRSANRVGGYVIDTSTVGGFRGGFFCNVMGPQSRRQARMDRNYMRRQGLSTAYIKYGC